MTTALDSLVSRQDSNLRPPDWKSSAGDPDRQTPYHRLAQGVKEDRLHAAVQPHGDILRRLSVSATSTCAACGEEIVIPIDSTAGSSQEIDEDEAVREWAEAESNVSQSICEVCSHLKEVTSGTGSRFLFCQRSQHDRRFPKYPPQPVVRCEAFEKVKNGGGEAPPQL